MAVLSLRIGSGIPILGPPRNVYTRLQRAQRLDKHGVGSVRRFGDDDDEVTQPG